MSGSSDVKIANRRLCSCANQIEEAPRFSPLATKDLACRPKLQVESCRNAGGKIQSATKGHSAGNHGHEVDHSISAYILGNQLDDTVSATS